MESKHLAKIAEVSRTVREYLAEMAEQNPVAESEVRPPLPPSMAAQVVSAMDPDAYGTGKGGTDYLPT